LPGQDRYEHLDTPGGRQNDWIFIRGLIAGAVALCGLIAVAIGVGIIRDLGKQITRDVELLLKTEVCKGQRRTPALAVDPGGERQRGQLGRKAAHQPPEGLRARLL
jgi:hypothetical protein